MPNVCPHVEGAWITCLPSLAAIALLSIAWGVISFF